jgi:hypothetical protein
MKRKRPAEAGQGAHDESLGRDTPRTVRSWTCSLDHATGCAMICFASSRVSPFAIMIFKTISTAWGTMCGFSRSVSAHRLDVRGFTPKNVGALVCGMFARSLAGSKTIWRSKCKMVE